MTDIIKFGHEDFADFRFLSNFYLSDIEIDGKVWPSTEHYYQAMKTLDFSMQEKIRTCGSPGNSKKLGRSAKIRADWDKIKEKVMMDALRAKFRPGSNMASLLLLTEDHYLAEWAPWDEWWGLGRRGTGKNRLGYCLMKVRAELRGEEYEMPPIPNN